MKLASQELVLKSRVPMRGAKRGMQLMDQVRVKGVEYFGADSEALLGELQTLWAEFCEIAFEDGVKAPPYDALDFAEVLGAFQGFTTARSSPRQ